MHNKTTTSNSYFGINATVAAHHFYPLFALSFSHKSSEKYEIVLCIMNGCGDWNSHSQSNKLLSPQHSFGGNRHMVALAD